MSGKATRKQSSKDLEQSRKAILKEALSRPGAREALKRHNSWQKQDHALDSYRSATEGIGKISVTDSANARNSS